MKPLAVIGAGGFVGTRLIESMVLAGTRPARAIVRSYKSLAGLSRFGTAVEVRLANAENASALADALAGADVAVNLTTGIPAGIVRSTATIHEACLAAGVRRLIHMSSAVVYGDVLEPTGDDDPPLARHWMPYARAKGASEVWLRERAGHPALEVVVLRPGLVWGVRSPHTIELARALAGKHAFLVGRGSGIYNGVYIDNLVAAVLAAAAQEARVDGFFNVGDAETVTWRQFYSALGMPLGCDPDRLPVVSETTFPRSLGATVDAVQNQTVVNAIYHRVKGHIPDAVKAAIKARLAGSYNFDRHPAAYAATASVGRELWHLQRVRHKLPVAKFGATFGFQPLVSFDAGIARTLAWLDTLGLVPDTARQSGREVA